MKMQSNPLPHELSNDIWKWVFLRRSSSTLLRVMPCRARSKLKLKSFSRPATYLEIARSCASKHRPRPARGLALHRDYSINHLAVALLFRDLRPGRSNRRCHEMRRVRHRTINRIGKLRLSQRVEICLH